MGFIQYVKESYKELSENMTWVSKEEAQKSTVMVATFTVVFALIIAAIDQVFHFGLDKFFKLF